MDAQQDGHLPDEPVVSSPPPQATGQEDAVLPPQPNGIRPTPSGNPPAANHAAAPPTTSEALTNGPRTFDDGPRTSQTPLVDGITEDPDRGAEISREGSPARVNGETGAAVNNPGPRYEDLPLAIRQMFDDLQGTTNAPQVWLAWVWYYQIGDPTPQSHPLLPLYRDVGFAYAAVERFVRENPRLRNRGAMVRIVNLGGAEYNHQLPGGELFDTNEVVYASIIQTYVAQG